MAARDCESRDAKSQLRHGINAARKALLTKTEYKSQLDAAVADHSFAALRHFGAVGRPIAAYTPLPSEPGPADYPSQLAVHARTVWLPIALSNGRLAWAVSAPSTHRGALGITEPDGARFTSKVLRSCALVIAPAMAVDKQGMRLGKGAGYYDRALAGLEVPVVAVVYDDEFLDAVPHDTHDVPVHGVITPTGFFAW